MLPLFGGNTDVQLQMKQLTNYTKFVATVNIYQAHLKKFNKSAPYCEKKGVKETMLIKVGFPI